MVRESLLLKKEPTNEKDRLAVCIQREGQVVGHVPQNLPPLFHYFLDREVNVAEVTAVPVNCGAGMGMEVPCVFRLYGPVPYVQRLEKC